MFTAKITDNFSFLILTTSGSCMIPTSNCFYVIILTNFYQLPWLKEKEIKRKRSMVRQSRPRHYIMVYLFRQYHCSFRFIGIETARKTNLPKQNFKQFPNTCFEF